MLNNTPALEEFGILSNLKHDAKKKINSVDSRISRQSRFIQFVYHCQKFLKLNCKNRVKFEQDIPKNLVVVGHVLQTMPSMIISCFTSVFFVQNSNTMYQSVTARYLLLFTKSPWPSPLTD